MVAERITVGVFALNQVLLPQAASGKGWAVRLAETVPVLADGAVPIPMVLHAGPMGQTLAMDAELSGTLWRTGLDVTVEPVAARPGLFMIRIGRKVAGLASAAPWSGGEPFSADTPEDPAVLAAYAEGTLIDTPDGPRAVETLAAGDTVTTLANGSRPLRWVGRVWVSPVELLANPGLRPVNFAPGAIGNHRTLVVSPHQRMLIDDWRAAVYFGEDRVLVSAQALVDDQSARLVLPATGVNYVILLCDRHEVLLAEGALSESFHPGETGLAGLSPTARAAIAAILPEADLHRRRAAFPIVHNAEARALRL